MVDGRWRFSSIRGVRKLGVGDKIDADTLFRLASVSKTFTSAAVAQMEQGILHFDSKVDTHLPNLKLSNAELKTQITLRHLLSHTTGLVPHAYTNLVQANVPYATIITELEKVEFVCKPGACYGYQNVVYSLVGDILARAGKAPYEAIVDEKLFKPLGMSKSSFGRAAFMAEKIVLHRTAGIKKVSSGKR